MSEWRKFRVKESDFPSKKRYDNYRELTRCAICHKKIEIGEEFDLRSIQSKEEMKNFNDSGYTSLAVIVHKECVEK